MFYLFSSMSFRLFKTPAGAGADRLLGLTGSQIYKYSIQMPYLLFTLYHLM